MTAQDWSADRPHQTHTGSEQQTGHETGPGEPVRAVVRVVGAGPCAESRPGRVVGWIGWHLGELVGVGVPAVLAVTVHPLWTVPAVLVATGWVANEVRLSRSRSRRPPSGPGRAPGGMSSAGDA